jgi:hypothetical protein
LCFHKPFASIYAAIKVPQWYAVERIDSSFFLLKRKKNRTSSQPRLNGTGRDDAPEKNRGRHGNMKLVLKKSFSPNQKPNS